MTPSVRYPPAAASSRDRVPSCLAAASRMSLAASSHLNEGNVYAETVPAAAAGQRLLDFLACRYTHSSREAWSAPTTTPPTTAARHHHCRSLSPLATATHHHHTPATRQHHSPSPTHCHHCRSAHGEAGRICLDAVPGEEQSLVVVVVVFTKSLTRNIWPTG